MRIASVCVYTMLGDSFSQLFKSVGAFQVLQDRNNALYALATLILAPLCSLQSLHALAPFSALGLAGTLFTALVIALRYLDGSYSLIGVDTVVASATATATVSAVPRTTGRFLGSLSSELLPSFGQSPHSFSFFSPSSFILLSMLSTAFVAHYHAPRLYMELKDRSIARLNIITSCAFGASAVIYMIMMATGFLTFGGHSSSFILNNYASTDKLATAARLAVGITLLTGYPLVFFALRDGIIDTFNLGQYFNSATRMRLGSLALLGSLTAISSRLRDVGFVVSISGALCGCTLMFIFPAIMSICNENRNIAKIKASLIDAEYSAPYWKSTDYSRISAPSSLSPFSDAAFHQQGVAAEQTDTQHLLQNSLSRSVFRKLLSILMCVVGIVMAVIGVVVTVSRELGLSL